MSPCSSAAYCSTRAHSSSPAPSRPPRRPSLGPVSTLRLQSPLSRLVSNKDKVRTTGFHHHQHHYHHYHHLLQHLPPLSCDTVDPMSLDPHPSPLSRHRSHPDHPPSAPLTPPADEEDDRSRWRPVRGLSSPKPHMLMDQDRSHTNPSPPDSHHTLRSSFDQPSHRPSLDGDENMSEPHDGSSPKQWLDTAIDTILSDLLVDANNRIDSIRLVSQTLPFPQSPKNTMQLPTRQTVFATIIGTFRERYQPEVIPYIHVIHAVPEDFSLANLPPSPPSTPGNSRSMDNYFDSNMFPNANPTVFASASTVPAYHDTLGFARQVNWPHPIVPPFSTHISVLERYIPPSTPREYRDMFTYGRPSVLTDRMLELSPNGGCLLFIYPTKRGATTFKSQYLGPILDPLLRHLVVVDGFSADVSRDIGRLEAVNSMGDFETMKAEIEQLCQRWSNQASNFRLVASEKGLAPLDCKLWKEWYTQQERPRIKDLLSRNWQTLNRYSNSPDSGGGHLTASMILAKIMDGLKMRDYDVSPHEDIELGVFVIRRYR